MIAVLPPPPASLLVRPGDRAMRMGWVGEASGRPPRDRGEVWIVCHAAGNGERWTHLYRIDPRDPRTVYLERAAPGESVAALRRWALRHLGLAQGAGLVPLAA
ncbi:hypothetical protein [Aureimonas sp. AU4]|uniref:hypothetical protein n=1 Tax=Aureimonas sp. AU4 TaxID=1638163 RepID=UPI000706EAD7|nr:hypothetical protein [Aureimonas sp. AU4]BAT30309.1 hypothetical protein [Aureimonas sp. AU4]